MADIDLRTLFDTALKAADPYPHIAPHLPAPPKGKLVVIGAGKATARMARAVEDHYADCRGVIAIPHGGVSACAKIDTIHAAHPVPGSSSETAARIMIKTVSGLTADDLVIALISGGGSSLLAAPAPGLSLRDKQRVTEDLLASGAPITDINIVRRALSAIKGGKLAAAARPARVLTLIVSDVPGNDPGAVASGPTIPAATTRADAAAILARYKIPLPPGVERFLLASMIAGGDQPVARADAHIVRRGQDMLNAVEETARQRGVPVVNLGDAVEGETAAVARAHAEKLLTLPENTLLLSGGETTVSLAGQTRPGRGGRNTTYLLELALALEDRGDLYALACDTDGIDGAAEAAGAMVRPGDLARMRRAGANPAALARSHASAAAFSAIGALICTGQTGTNLNDFRCALFRAGPGAAVRL